VRRDRHRPTEEEILAAVVELADDGFCERRRLAIQMRSFGERALTKGIARAARRSLILERRGPDRKTYLALTSEGWQVHRASDESAVSSTRRSGKGRLQSTSPPGRARPHGHDLRRKRMADVTPLEEKLGEVIGLAEAAQEAANKVGSLLEDDSQAGLLESIKNDSEETAKRGRKVAQDRVGDSAGVLEQAEETRKEGVEMMKSYLDEGSDGLDGFEFLIMTEAGEAGHWAILGKLNEKAGEEEIGELVDWALPVQERHLSKVREASLELAAEEDPDSE
jgi:hypothetical protein